MRGDSANLAELDQAEERAAARDNGHVKARLDPKSRSSRAVSARVNKLQKNLQKFHDNGSIKAARALQVQCM